MERRSAGCGAPFIITRNTHRSGKTMRFDLGSIRAAIAFVRVLERIVDDATGDGRNGA